MAVIKHHKVVAALPETLEPDSVYYVRAGDGVDTYVTNGAGLIVAYKVNGGGSVAVVRRSQLITESGTWDRPTGMVGDVVHLTQIGGGASCRPSATVTNRRGGNGGQWHINVPVDIGAATSVACTVGAGGDIPGANDTQNPGGATSFGAFLTSLGGPVSTVASPPFSAPGGTPTGSTAGPDIAQGGDTPLGYGGRSIATSTAGGGGGLGLGLNPPTVNGSSLPAGDRPAQGYGAGGSVSNAPAATYCAGVQGVILVEWDEVIEL